MVGVGSTEGRSGIVLQHERDIFWASDFHVRHKSIKHGDERSLSPTLFSLYVYDVHLEARMSWFAEVSRSLPRRPPAAS
jgi:hypothetical protein